MFEDLYEALKNLPKEYLNVIILQLMKDEKITFSELADMHVKYIEGLKQGNLKELSTLRANVIELWCGTRKELPSKLVSLIKKGKSEGWVNITEEKIEKSKWNKGGRV